MCVFIIKRFQHSGSLLLLLLPLAFCAGDAKSEETANKDAGEEKPEEDNDYHRSDEQVRPRRHHGECSISSHFPPNVSKQQRSKWVVHKQETSWLLLWQVYVIFCSLSYYKYPLDLIEWKLFGQKQIKRWQELYKKKFYNFLLIWHFIDTIISL